VQAAAEPREQAVQRLLHPTAAVPPHLALADRGPLSNTAAAACFADAAAAEQAMSAGGRVTGATVAYHARPHPRSADTVAADAATAVTTIEASVAVYGTATAAGAVLTDASLPLVLHALGLNVTEAGVAGGRVGEEHRVFHGTRAGEAATVVVFQQANTVGTVTVVGSSTPEARTELARTLARAQAATPIPLALTPALLAS
jgi:hypothetical protein